MLRGIHAFLSSQHVLHGEKNLCMYQVFNVILKYGKKKRVNYFAQSTHQGRHLFWISLIVSVTVLPCHIQCGPAICLLQSQYKVQLS